ncbi:MAG TPA: AlpA family phage regulatory protein [Noviherbaspirillum sp.]|uniref:helix-turn-helix transcriptional regulator n=1 Tax=Noviherbaspirillum sp. TaxID=1926288 RepID=UPI002B49E516|nr:AlpA family phage regulatory protein [Noviherbaspirillum sp.]HJV84309.1 AlpA family phage regulatory protein [Noviherbaspirillum sp.]
MDKKLCAAGSGTPINRAQRRAIRFKRVREIVPFGATQIYALIAANRFPRPFKLVQGGRASAFWEDEIYDWLETRAAASQEGK